MGGATLLFMRGHKGDINIRGAFLRIAPDAGISAGLVVAGLVIVLTGRRWPDPVMSLVLVAVGSVGAWGLLKVSVALAIDQAPSGISRDAVFERLVMLIGVKGVHDLHIWPLSTTSIALTVHLVCVGDRIDVDLKARLKIDHATSQFETGSLTCDLETDHVV
jgi:cobalt-zinc-cadmium efflux system protein